MSAPFYGTKAAQHSSARFTATVALSLSLSLSTADGILLFTPVSFSNALLPQLDSPSLRWPTVDSSYISEKLEHIQFRHDTLSTPRTNTFEYFKLLVKSGD